jgi:hypothetical protein
MGRLCRPSHVWSNRGAIYSRHTDKYCPTAGITSARYAALVFPVSLFPIQRVLVTTDVLKTPSTSAAQRPGDLLMTDRTRYYTAAKA